MRAKEYPLLADGVELGVTRGWNRAHKHVENPSPEAIQESVVREVVNEVCERFHIDEEPEQ